MFCDGMSTQVLASKSMSLELRQGARTEEMYVLVHTYDWAGECHWQLERGIVSPSCLPTPKNKH